MVYRFHLDNDENQNTDTSFYVRKKLTMDEIHDIHGLRLIVDNEKDCYKALGVVHKLWSEVPGKLKDYISHPKFNGWVLETGFVA